MSIGALRDTCWYSLSCSDGSAAAESDILWLGRRGTDHSEMRRDTSLFQCPTEFTAVVVLVRLGDLYGSADHLLLMLELFADMWSHLFVSSCDRNGEVVYPHIHKLIAWTSGEHAKSRTRTDAPALVSV